MTGILVRALRAEGEVIWTWTASVVMTVVVQRTVGLDWPSAGLVASAAAVPALLVAAVRPRLRRWAMPVAVTLVALLAVANTLHYRVFGSYIPLRSFMLAGQALSVRDYALGLVCATELVPVLAVAVTVAAVLRRPRTAAPATPRWRGVLAVVACVLGLVPAVRWALVVAPRDNEPYAGGFLYDHIVDARRILDERQIGREPAPPDLERVLRFTSRPQLDPAGPGNGDDAWRGIAAGANLLLIQVEALNGWLIHTEVGGEPVLPFLRSLAERGMLFTSVFDQTHQGRSSDADHLVMASQHPLEREAVSMVRPGLDMEALPDVLRKRGYATLAAQAVVPGFWNAGERYVRYGFQESLFRADLGPGDSLGFGLSDRAVFQNVAGDLADLPDPWLGYLTTLTMHGPHEELPPELRTLPLGGLDGTSLGNYLLKARYTDDAIRMLLDSLGASGDLARTMVVVYGDHTDGHRINRTWLHRLTGTEDLAADAQALLLDRIVLVVAPPAGTTIPGGAGARVTTVGGLIDLAPTLLLLLGVEQPRWFLGRSLLAPGPSMAAQASGQAVGDGLMWTGTNCYSFPDAAPRTNETCATLRRRAREELEVSWLITWYGLNAEPGTSAAVPHHASPR